MHLFFRYLSYLIACLAMGGVLSCQPSPDAQHAKQLNPEGVLRLYIGGEPTVLNPVLSTDQPSSTIESYIFSGMMRVNETLDLEPDMATTYNVSEDGLRYTFYLRKNILWHDGVPMTAHDVKFTFEKILDPKTNTVRRSDYVIDGKPVQFDVVDNHTLLVTLPTPFAPFLSNMSMGIIPKHLLEKADFNKAAFNRQPIGTGPFIFDRWQAGQYVKVKRNETFYGSKAKVSTCLIKIIPNQTTALVAFEKGEIDEVGIPNKDFPRIRDKKEAQIFRYYGLNYTYMGFNLKHPFLKDKQVRQALSHAINKSAIVEGVLLGYGRPSFIPASPVSWAYPDDESVLPAFPYDTEKSSALLSSAGFTLNPKTKILERDGQPFELTLMTNKGNKDREKTAQIIQKFLGNIGIKLTLQLMEWSSFIKIINAPTDPKNFDLVILGWGLGIDPDGYSIWHSKEYPKGFNFIGYNNPRVDQLLIEGRRTVGKLSRKKIYEAFYKEIAEDQPYVFLYHTESLVGINERVQGLSPAGPAGLMNRIEDVYVVE